MTEKCIHPSLVLSLHKGRGIGFSPVSFRAMKITPLSLLPVICYLLMCGENSKGGSHSAVQLMSQRSSLNRNWVGFSSIIPGTAMLPRMCSSIKALGIRNAIIPPERLCCISSSNSKAENLSDPQEMWLFNQAL